MLSRPIEKVVAVVALSLAMLSTGMTAERAASIEYETVGRPANLQGDFIAPPDASSRFLTIKAIHGSRVDAVFCQPDSKTVTNSTLVVSVHGSGGSYDSDAMVRILCFGNAGL